MDPINTQQIGDTAEVNARAFLEAKGMRCLEEKYTCYSGEIDLIMEDQEDIVFVEVRFRTNITRGNALESVDNRKQMKLIKAATMFLQAKKWLHKRNSRFDVVAIHPIAGKMQLEWVKNAFMIDKYW